MKSHAVVGAAIIALTLAGCGDAYRYYSSGPVGLALKKQVRELKVVRLKLSEVTPFQWSDVFIFAPYTPQEEVCKRLRVNPPDCSAITKGRSVDEGKVLLVFRNAQRIVHSELHYRYHGDFTPVPAIQPIPKDQAVFKASQEGQASGGEPWIKLTQE